MKIWLSSLVFIVILFVASPFAQAQTTSKPSPTRTVTGLLSPTPTKIVPDNFGANWEFIYNEKTLKYQMKFNWTDIKDVRGYNITYSKIPGDTPEKKMKTVRSEFVFNDVSPGEWYVNLIAQKKDRTWGEVLYWKVETPDAAIDEESTEPEEELSVDDIPDSILGETTTLEEDDEISTVRAKVQNLIRSITGDEPTGEVDEEGNTVTKKSSANGKYTCNCKKSCTQIRSCNEAYFQLNTCGCNEKVDADDDGIPCENRCGEN